MKYSGSESHHEKATHVDINAITKLCLLCIQSDPTQSNCYTQHEWLNQLQPIKQLFRVASHQIQCKQELTILK